MTTSRSDALTNDQQGLRKALTAAKKKIRVLSKKHLNANLECFCGDLAEAYACGVEEAQAEIISRIDALLAKKANSPALQEVDRG